MILWKEWEDTIDGARGKKIKPMQKLMWKWKYASLVEVNKENKKMSTTHCKNCITIIQYERIE
jgi:hypothetical protein